MRVIIAVRGTARYSARGSTGVKPPKDLAGTGAARMPR